MTDLISCPPSRSCSSFEIHDVETVQSTTAMDSHKHPYHLPKTFPPFLLRKIVSEMIATFLLVFVTCGAAALHESGGAKVSQLGASVAGGLIVTVMIYSVGHISGAHMNPAVTFAFAVSKHGQFPWIQVPFYWSAQMIGATVSSFALKLMLSPITNLGTTTPSGTPLQALIMEVVVTFCMMFVASAVATDSKAVGELAGLAVGSSVCLTSILAGYVNAADMYQTPNLSAQGVGWQFRRPISGGSMNPARTLGPALASKQFNSLWVYFLGPFIGTLSGALSYNFVRLDNLRRSEPLKVSSFKLRRWENDEKAKLNNSSIPN